MTVSTRRPICPARSVRAGELASQGEALLHQVGEGRWLGLLCFRWHAALAAGGSAAEILDRARRIAKELSCIPGTELGKAIAQLERTEAAFGARQALIAGHCPEDLTAGQLRWLRAHRPAAIPPQVMARLNEDGTLRPEESTDRGRAT